MNTPTPAQALGEVMALSARERGLAITGGGDWLKAYKAFTDAARNLVIQHGQHFAGLEQELAAAREAMAKKDSMLGEAPCRGLNADGNLRCLTTANLAKCAERVATTLEMPTLVKQSRSNPNAGFIDWRDWQALKSEMFDLRAALATLQRDRQP